MVSKFFPNMKNYEKGISLIEIVVVIFIIILFSTILISDFPKIKTQFSLSQGAYKLAQDLRKAQDLGLSGVRLNDANRQPIAVKGYGVYIDISSPPAEQYAIYADVPDADGNSDQKYSGGSSYPLCEKVDQGYPITNPRITDCVIEVIDLRKENPSLYIKSISGINGTNTSINFSPPDPITKIDNLSSGQSAIGIILGLTSDSSAKRTVQVNTSGLINVQ
jgi:type II secretory pathway pseudopilin PulG